MSQAVFLRNGGGKISILVLLMGVKKDGKGNLRE